ncbi:MAG: F0F1 ATP synthase subunit B [Planctomycetota bacterium]
MSDPFVSKWNSLTWRRRLLATSIILFIALGGISIPEPSGSWSSPLSSPVMADHHEEGDNDHAEGEHDHGEEGDHADADHSEAGHDGEHHGPPTPPLLSLDPGAAIWNLLIFLSVLAVLSKFVWPNVLAGLKAREDKIRSDLSEAEKANADAQGLLADYQAKLDDAQAQVQSMLAEARKDAEASGQRIIEEAKAEADQQRDRALADIETAKKVALADLADQTSSMAISVAGKVVGRELSVDNHADLIRSSMDQLASNGEAVQ